MNDNTESTNRPNDDLENDGDPVAYAAKILMDAGIDIYGPMSELDHYLHAPSTSPHLVMTEAEMEALIKDEDFEELDDEDIEDIREYNNRKMFDWMCGSDPCEHPEHND